MSGIVGIVNLDGAPVDRKLLQRMTDSLNFRGPDANQIWIKDYVGFGLTLLRTTDEAALESQPFSFDKQTFIVAYARIDAREELIAKLHAKGRLQASLSRPDIELILHAYHVWGEGCVQHFLGDFAFAIWDARNQKLFCARDHFGIKPFFYAHKGNQFIFSNTLNTVRLHPAVTDELNEQAIGDFLLFDANQDLSTSTFADIQRVPPAHSLSVTKYNKVLSRFWDLPDGDLIQFRRKQDYIDQFHELLNVAVADRLRTTKVGVLMSGGLDSPAVAAAACNLLEQKTGVCDMHAYTVVFDRLFPDEERHYAGLVAEALNIPIHYLAADDYLPFEGAANFELRSPEPYTEPFLRLGFDLSNQLVSHHRVVLTGSDGDTILAEQPNYYFGYLFRKLRFARLLFEMGRHAFVQRELPRIGFRAMLRRIAGKQWNYEYPSWLNPSFAKRLKLRERLEEFNREKTQHPFRPAAYRVLASPRWAQHFEDYDAGLTMFPIEYRHPLADLRLIDFAFSLPPTPWLIRKRLLRIAMSGILPESVCVRPKSPLGGDKLIESLRNQKAHWVDEFEPTPRLASYVERNAIPSLVGEQNTHQIWMNARALSIHFWLASLELDNHLKE